METIESIYKRHEKNSALWDKSLAMREAWERLDSAIWINVKNADKAFFAPMPAEKVQALYNEYYVAQLDYELAVKKWDDEHP